MNPTFFWIISAGALVVMAVRLLGIEGAILTGLVWGLFHLLRPGRGSAEDNSKIIQVTRPDSVAESDLPLVEIELGDELDLHTFHPADVRKLVPDYLESSIEKGRATIRIVHGKGQGVQRAIVRKLLADHPAVDSFGDAPPERGGWGATLVRLKNRSLPEPRPFPVSET